MHRTMLHAWTRCLPALVLAGGLFVTGCGGSTPVATDAVAQLDTLDPALAYTFQPAPADGLTYSGTLTDSTGTPVEGADVLVAGDLATITGEDGGYTVTVAPGTDQLEFAISDFVFHTVTLDPTTRTVQAQPGDPGEPSRGAVNGRVTDRDGGVDGALVVFANREGFFKWTTTGPEGGFDLGLVPAGPGVIGATARMHEVEVRSVIVRQNTLNTFPIHLAKFPPHGHLVGVVFDDDSTRDDLQPIAGAKVTLYRVGHPERRLTVRTNHNGAYFFGLIPAGEYRLVVRAEGYCPKVRTVLVEKGRNFRNVKLADADPTAPCENVLPPDWPGDEGPGEGLGDDEGGN